MLETPEQMGGEAVDVKVAQGGMKVGGTACGDGVNGPRNFVDGPLPGKRGVERDETGRGSSEILGMGIKRPIDIITFCIYNRPA